LGLLIDKIYWKIIWILTGLLFGIAGSLMIISGAFCADRFYDAGKVYDVEENGRKSCWNDTIHYDETTQVLVVDTDTAVKNTATIVVTPVASPSSPSVKLTPLTVPITAR